MGWWRDKVQQPQLLSAMAEIWKWGRCGTSNLQIAPAAKSWRVRLPPVTFPLFTRLSWVSPLDSRSVDTITDCRLLTDESHQSKKKCQLELKLLWGFFPTHRFRRKLWHSHVVSALGPSPNIDCGNTGQHKAETLEKWANQSRPQAAWVH